MSQKVITTENLHEVTEQEVFDYVAEKIFEQGKPAYDTGQASCTYRLGNLKCAAGHLIRDEDYKEEYKYSTWYTLVENDGFPEIHERLISKLQFAHDNSVSEIDPSLFLTKFDSRLAEVANDFNLEYKRKYEN